MPTLRREDGLIYRCSYRPEDTEANVAPPYELQRDRYGKHSAEYANFRVVDNVITILRTDALPDNRVPDSNILPQRNGDIVYSRAVPFEENDVTGVEWRKDIGVFIAAVMFGIRKDEGGDRFILADFPANYAFYVWKKTWENGTHRPRTDVYLRVDEDLRFASPLEFARHAMWLMDGKPERRGRTACICQYCAPQTTQTIISSDMRILAGCPTKRDLARVDLLERAR